MKPGRGNPAEKRSDQPAWVARLLALVPNPHAIEVMTHALGQRDAAGPAARSPDPDPRPAAPPPQTRRRRPGRDPVLVAEREYLSQSRQFLRLMREDVLSLRALGGDPVSEEYLKADLYRRAEALSDLPDTPLFFGRLDYAPRRQAGTAASSRASGSTSAGGTCTTRRAIRSWSTGGRRCPAPSTGPARPTRWDWNCAAGSASPAASSPRTRTRCSPGGRAPLAPAAAVSRILIEEIERPRSGPMRDIVATIAPDQDDIVRAGARPHAVRPGRTRNREDRGRPAPDRLPALRLRRRMARGGVLVIGPNRAFLSYIRDVLPALGEVDVAQMTLADLLARVPVRASDTAGAAQVKGDARMAEVLRRALWAGLAEPAEPLVRGPRLPAVAGQPR